MDKITNFYEIADKVLPDKNNYFNPYFDITQMVIPFRCLVIGSTGAGKTDSVLEYLKRAQNTFKYIYICYKQKEKLYELLDKKINEPLRKAKLDERVMFFDDINKFPNVDEMPKDGQILVIFDDLVLDKNQGKIGQYFIRGRKHGMGISMFYLAQSYYGIQNKIIRQNMNYIWLNKLPSDKDIKVILSEYSLGVDKNEILNMYKYATSVPFSFLKIDLQTNDPNKRFSQGFVNFIAIE